MQWDCLGIKGLAKTNAFNDEPKDDHALLVEWKDCDQLFNLYYQIKNKFVLQIGTLNGWQPHKHAYNN